jgi:hypothetical protein
MLNFFPSNSEFWTVLNNFTSLHWIQAIPFRNFWKWSFPLRIRSDSLTNICDFKSSIETSHSQSTMFDWISENDMWSEHFDRKISLSHQSLVWTSPMAKWADFQVPRRESGENADHDRGHEWSSSKTLTQLGNRYPLKRPLTISTGLLISETTVNCSKRPLLRNKSSQNDPQSLPWQ